MEHDWRRRVIRIYGPDRHIIEVGEAMQFVIAREEDAPELMNLYRAAVGTEGCTWTEDYPNEEILNMDLKKEAAFLLKNGSGEILAAVSLDDDTEVNALPCWSPELTPSVELARLVVREDHRNEGLARVLLRRTMHELHDRGYRSVHYLVSKANERALRSYAKLEFIRVGESNLYGEHWWCYEKALQELI